jgi:hypothetical protein
VSRSPRSSLTDRLADVETALGREAFEAATAANSHDLTIFESIRSRFRDPATHR